MLPAVDGESRKDELQRLAAGKNELQRLAAG
jgi:hypothetical protein